MSGTEFAPTEIFIHGPDVPTVVRSQGRLSLVMGHGPVPVIIMRGTVPFRKSMSYPRRNDSRLKITPARILRKVAFEFCGELITPIVEVASTSDTTDDLDEIVRALQPLLDYMRGKFVIV